MEHEELSARTMRFPADRSIGSVVIEEPEGEEPLKQLDAQGDILLPAGHTILWLTVEESPDLAFLDGFPGSEITSLTVRALTDEGMARIVRLARLSFLEIEKCRAGDAALAGLAGLPALTDLALDTPAVTAAHLRAIGTIRRLERLYLSTPELDRTGLPALGALHDLVRLSLACQPPPTAGDLAFCAGLPSLRELDLEPYEPDAEDPGTLEASARLPYHIAFPDLEINGFWYPPKDLVDAAETAGTDDADSVVRPIPDASTFDTLTARGAPVLAYFTAPWCGPCRRMGPIVDDVATLYRDRMTVAKIDIDEVEALADRYDVRGIPQLILFADGAETWVDAQGMRGIVEAVEPLLGR